LITIHASSAVLCFATSAKSSSFFSSGMISISIRGQVMAFRLSQHLDPNMACVFSGELSLGGHCGLGNCAAARGIGGADRAACTSCSKRQIRRALAKWLSGIPCDLVCLHCTLPISGGAVFPPGRYRRTW
jgi:hypothetical protein